MKSMLRGWLCCLLLCCSVFAAYGQTAQEMEELERSFRQAEQEMKEIMKCDKLIRALEESLSQYEDGDRAAYLLMQEEVKKAKADILKNCVNGIYQPQEDSPVEEAAEPEPPMTETEKKLVKWLEGMDKGAVANTETYGETYYAFTKIPKRISFYMESTVTQAQFPQWMAEKYGVKLRKLHQDAISVKYQQTLDGMPLLGCLYTLMLRKDGSIQSASGLLYPAKKANPGAVKGYASIFEKIRSKYTDIRPAADSALIYVQQKRDYSDSNFYLCYTFYDDRTAYYFDAVEGQLMHQETYVFNCFHHEHSETDAMEAIPQPQEVSSVANPSMVKTYYYGMQKVETLKLAENMFMLRSNIPDNRNAVIVFDSLTPAYRQYTPACSDNLWTNGKYLEKGLIDAFIGGEKTMAYFKQKFGRQSFDNSGTSLDIYFMPFTKKGSVNDNAEWDERHKIISYGWTNGKPLTSVDIIAHEFTHAVVGHHVPGLMNVGEIGAINEGLCDIMASAVEKYSAFQGTNHWKMLEMQGEKSFRDFSAPNPAIYADTYEGNNWIDQKTCFNSTVQKDQCGVHINSTVISHWYYLLVNGGTGKNDHNKPYDVTAAFTVDEAAELAYESILFLMPHMNFKDFADMVIGIAENKYGEQDLKTCTVKHAWYAVGVLPDIPEKCVPGWAFTIYDGPTAKTQFFGKGDSIVITMLDRETGFRTKMYRNKQSAFWKVVGETEDGIERMTIPNDFMQQMMSYDNAKDLTDFQHEYMEESIRQMKQRLTDPDLTPEERAEANYMLRNAEEVYATSKAMSEKSLAEIKENELENSQYPTLMTQEEFWGSNRDIRDFDKQFLKGTFDYEGLTAKLYDMGNEVSWISTTEMPYGLGDLAFILPGTMGDKKLGVDHFMRGFPLSIYGQKIATNIKQYLPDNFDTIFSDAAVF